MASTSLYSRLFTYSQSQNRSKLENFLTEGLADLLSRDITLSREFIWNVLLKNRANNAQASADALGQRLAGANNFDWHTQKSFEGMQGRPDISVFTNDDNKRPLILVENKIYVGFTHTVLTRRRSN